MSDGVREIVELCPAKLPGIFYRVGPLEAWPRIDPVKQLRRPSYTIKENVFKW